MMATSFFSVLVLASVFLGHEHFVRFRHQVEHQDPGANAEESQHVLPKVKALHQIGEHPQFVKWKTHVLNNEYDVKLVELCLC